LRIGNDGTGPAGARFVKKGIFPWLAFGSSLTDLSWKKKIHVKVHFFLFSSFFAQIPVRSR
jgi:hypothetical protein